MVFCAYCGKSFTRKEHLERHIPSHTNVKPHRCTSCHLSFSRRDLLQRHHSTYHEVKDPTQPHTGNPPTIAGRTPIACINCANAKTGCDKVVPCARCADKNLPCAARFARRATKPVHRVTESREAPALHTADVTTNTTSNVSSSGDFQQIAPDHALEPQVPSNQVEDMTQSSQANFDLQHFNLYPEFLPYQMDLMDSDFQFEDMLGVDYPIDSTIFDSALPQPSLNSIAAAHPGKVSSGSSATTNSVRAISIPNTRGTSITSKSDMPMEFECMAEGSSSSAKRQKRTNSCDTEAMIAAESAWPLARCNPPIFSGSCPRTAILHLESLECNSKNDGTWGSLTPNLGLIDTTHINQPSIEPMTASTRDKILTITQSFLHKALQIHRGGLNSRPKSPGYFNAPGFNFLVLPPTPALEHFLQNYARSLSSYYTMETGGKIDPNELMLNTQASTLLVLLMIAQGASTIPVAEPRALAAGLTETCRISLFDIIEKDVELSADPIVLRCALLFTVLGAWSGDKWHMDIVMGQRGMYLAMLKHSGAMESQQATYSTNTDYKSPELQWRAWSELESKNRLVYNWVLVDQELSLFYDTTPILSITDIEARMPDSERLWTARDSTEWLSILKETHRTSPGTGMISQMPMSLCELFQELLNNNLNDRHCQLTSLKLRLLLHPLQAMVSHLRQILSCFSDILGPRRGNVRSITKTSTMERLEEVQTLLRNWYDTAIAHSRANLPCLVSHISLIMYHLINLNVVSCFSEVERLARKDNFDGSHWELSLRHKRCIHQSTEAVFHAGQVIRLIKTLSFDSRPQWWPVAIYRAALILWVDCLAKTDPNFPQQPSSGPLIVIDETPPEDPSLARWMWTGDGVPMLKRRDGGLTKLEVPGDILEHCVVFLDEGGNSRMTDGVTRKLRMLQERWRDTMVDGSAC